MKSTVLPENGRFQCLPRPRRTGMAAPRLYVVGCLSECRVLDGDGSQRQMGGYALGGSGDSGADWRFGRAVLGLQLGLLDGFFFRAVYGDAGAAVRVAFGTRGFGRLGAARQGA